MIRPLFNVRQDENFIYIEAKVKYIKISEFEYFVEDNNFRFTLKPYYLNINLPGKLNSESQQNNFKYDPENQLLQCKIAKNIPGENFKNLEFLSSLQTQKDDKSLSGNKSAITKIEEINSNDNTLNSDNNSSKIENVQINNCKELNDYLFNVYTEIKNNNNNELENFNYGFNNNFFDVFDKRKEELIEICDLNPKKIPLSKRYLYKLEKENNDFDPERYITDMFLDDNKSDFYDDFFNEIISKNEKDKKFIESIKNKNSCENYNDIENEILYKISKLNLNSDNNFNKKYNFYLIVIDILFAYIYNCIITEYENSSESGWTINKLSSVLSCLIDYDLNYYSQSKEISFNILYETIDNLLISSYRRILIYPLYRNLKIAEKVKKIVIEILSLGRFSILKCLMKVKMIFDRNEPRFLLNVIYMDPLIKWIQIDAEDEMFGFITEKIKEIKITKEQLKLDLDVFEKDYLENEKEENNEMIIEEDK